MDVFASLIMRALRYFFSPYTFSIWALLVFGAVVTSPFGTYAPMTLGMRAVFWAVVGAVGIVLGHIVHAMCRQAARDRGVSMRSGCEMVVFTALFSPIAYGLAVTMSDGLQTSAFTMARVSFFVLVAAVMIRALRRILQGGDIMGGADGALPTSRTDTATPRLMRRLPEGVEGPILHLSARDHFVSVATPEGVHELRMRLRDAIDEMDSAEGLRTHRSHWVARGAIVDVRREEGRVVLVLENGTKVPVSRKYRPDLEASGVI